MDSRELSIRSKTLREVRDKLADEHAKTGNKRMGFSRAQEIVAEMHLNLLDHLSDEQKSDRTADAPRKVAAT